MTDLVTHDANERAAQEHGTTMRRLLRQRLIVCVGSGGVGKTTTAAALALMGAWARRDTAVITVDPAQRLKDSLGLTDLSTHPHRIPLADSDGILDALALDTKRTFDALVERMAPSEDIAKRIFSNRLYQELSSNLGGSAEYMAMEKLHELVHPGRYHLIVVDTPPGAHARDLLSAPLRMTELLASSAVRILKAPASILSGGDSRAARAAMSTVLRTLQRWTGIDLLRDLSDFAGSFEHLIEGFVSRAGEIEQALRRHTTSFLLVTTPEPDTVAATIEFHRELTRERFPVGGIIANRVHRFPELSASAADSFPEPLRHKLLANYTDFAALTRRDSAALAHLRRATRAPLLSVVPALEQPPASFEGLIRFARALTAGGQQEAARHEES